VIGSDAARIVAVMAYITAWWNWAKCKFIRIAVRANKVRPSIRKLAISTLPVYRTSPHPATIRLCDMRPKPLYLSGHLLYPSMRSTSINGLYHMDRNTI
jgi:hypothetical protein